MEGSNSMSYPEDYITREEAIVMFGRALGVQPNDDPDLSDFLDGEEVSGWAAPYMATLTELGILSGMGDGTVAPHADINRAGAFTLMDKAISVYANAPGTYTSQNANGFVVINANSQQEGEVILTGKATGVLVAVGASNPVRLRDLKAENVLVEGKGDVVVSGKSSVDALAANTEIAVTVDAEASVGTLDVNVEKIAVTNAGEIKKLNCGEAGSVTNSGKVAELVADAPSAITNTGTVDKLVANAAITVNNTKGTVKNAEINMGGVVMDGAPQQMTVASGVVRPANSSGRPITATGAVSSGGGGGGGGGGSRPTPTPTPTPVIKLDKTSAELTEGMTLTLKATVTPPSSDAIKGEVIWTSSDATVATVENGTVTAVKEGEATITAKVTITIPEPSPSPSPSGSPSPSPSTEPSAEPSPSEEPTPSPSPSETVTPSPSPSEEATPSPSPSEEATPSPSPSEEATPSPSPSETVTPDSEPGESSDPNPSEPVEGGSEGDGDTETELPPAAPAAFRARSAAPAALAAQAAPAARADNTKTYTATCKVTVKAKPVETVAVTGVTLDKTALELKVDETATLTPTVEPENATNKKVTWSSSEESVATVANGRVTAVAEGTATITVTTEDGGKTAECVVTVTNEGGDTPTTPSVTGVTVTPAKATIQVGGTQQLTANVAAVGGAATTVSWTSSEPEKASVNENGLVTANQVGENIIITAASTVDPSKSASCTVTVTAAGSSGDTEKFIVTFNINSGVAPSDSADYSQEVTKDETASAPAHDPTREGHTFIGWSTASGEYTAVDFDAPITAAVTYYAFWAQNVSVKDGRVTVHSQSNNAFSATASATGEPWTAKLTYQWKLDDGTFGAAETTGSYSGETLSTGFHTLTCQITATPAEDYDGKVQAATVTVTKYIIADLAPGGEQLTLTFAKAEGQNPGIAGRGTLTASVANVGENIPLVVTWYQKLVQDPATTTPGDSETTGTEADRLGTEIGGATEKKLELERIQAELTEGISRYQITCQVKLNWNELKTQGGETLSDVTELKNGPDGTILEGSAIYIVVPANYISITLDETVSENRYKLTFGEGNTEPGATTENLPGAVYTWQYQTSDGGAEWTVLGDTIGSEVMASALTAVSATRLRCVVSMGEAGGGHEFFDDVVVEYTGTLPTPTPTE